MRYIWFGTNNLRWQESGPYLSGTASGSSRVIASLEELFSNYFCEEWSSRLIFECVPDGDSDVQRRRLTTHLQSEQGFTNIPPEFAPVGVYSVILGNHYTANADGEPHRMTMAEVLAIYTENQNNAIIHACAAETSALAQEYMPPVGEIFGQPFSWTTHKTYAADHTFRNCGNCGRVGHDVRTCEHAAQVYDKVGIELEGRWARLNSVIDRARGDGLTASSDGSVNYRDDSDTRPYEIQTKPGSLGEALKQVVKYYPDEADASCGMHVHVSFAHATDFTCLSTTEFFAYFKARWEAWGAAKQLRPNSQFFLRLRGLNSYCIPNTQTPVRLTNVDRYHQLNFSAYGEHKTVECRLLPMFTNQELAVSAIQELIDIYQTFLANPEAHGLALPETDTMIAIVDQPAQEIKQEIVVPEPYLLAAPPISIELEDILPPAPGMMRIAIPGGRFDLAMLQRIAQLQKEAA